jgi:hypothetical protein
MWRKYLGCRNLGSGVAEKIGQVPDNARICHGMLSSCNAHLKLRGWRLS